MGQSEGDVEVAQTTSWSAFRSRRWNTPSMCQCRRLSVKSWILWTSPCLRSWKRSSRWPRSVPQRVMEHSVCEVSVPQEHSFFVLPNKEGNRGSWCSAHHRSMCACLRSWRKSRRCSSYHMNIVKNVSWDSLRISSGLRSGRAVQAAMEMELVEVFQLSREERIQERIGKQNVDTPVPPDKRISPMLCRSHHIEQVWGFLAPQIKEKSRRRLSLCLKGTSGSEPRSVVWTSLFPFETGGGFPCSFGQGRNRTGDGQAFDRHIVVVSVLGDT